MAEMVLQTRTLPQELLRLISTEKVKIRKSGGEVHLIPVGDSADMPFVSPVVKMFRDGIIDAEGRIIGDYVDPQVDNNDPFYNEANLARLRSSILEMELTGGTIRDISAYYEDYDDD
ncbi:MAG: hypothetical protein LBE35_04915 [Clostridiales bacterium]|jgi:hypothetical protein|nr:hypothetical protein [Clostridiales bacterium]